LTNWFEMQIKVIHHVWGSLWPRKTCRWTFNTSSS